MQPKSAFRRIAFPCLFVVAVCSGCGDSTAPNNDPAEIVITAVDTLRTLGATATLTAVVRNVRHEAMPGVAVSWESANPTVATVIATTGLVTAVANGSATITARAGNITSSTKAVVLQAPGSITLVAPLDTLRSLGETGQYTAVVKDAGGSTITAPVVAWTSTNPAVVAVDMVQGVATAVSNGAVYVKARSGGVVDSLPLVVRQRIDPTKSTITLTRPLLFVDDTVRATLQSRDALNHPLTFGGAAIVFSSQGGSSVGTFRPVVDNQNGTYSADFVGASLGTPLTVAASIDGAPVTSVLPTMRVVGFTRIAAAGGTLNGAVTTTGGFTCGIITTGDMYCWGISWFGVRGNGSLGSLTPGPTATVVSGSHQWTDVTAGRWYVCAVASGEGGYCWGSGGSGELGNGISGHGSADNVSIPTPITGGGAIGTVSIGGVNGGCAVTLTKTAMCWGAGVWGRLGNGSETDTNVPVAVSGGLSFDALSTSFSGTCGISAGSAYCWGIYSILGLGASPAPDTCTGPVACARTPFAVSGGRVFRPIMALDGNVACAVGTDDKAYCWGSGYLGTGSTGGASAPTPVSGGLSFTSLGSAGDSGHCGIALGGAAWCWGVNSNGRFGNGTTSDATIPTAASGGHAFTQLSMSMDHTCGVATDGNAWCWGGNDMGELGDGSTTRRLTPVRVKLFAP